MTFTTQPGKSSYTWGYLPSGATLISGGTSVDNTIVLKWITPGLKTVTVNYTDAGCTGDPPTSKQVTIKPLPVVNEPLTKNICSGDNTSITLSSSPVGANFAWNVPAPSCSANIFSCPAGVASGTTISDVLSLTDNNPGSVTYHIISTLNGCNGNTQNYVVNVNPLPTVNTVANQVLCHNAQSALIQFSGNVPGTIYNWTNTNTSIGLATNGTGDILSFQATNATTAPITATITVTPAYTNSGATCTGTSTMFTITVNPIPMVNPVTNQVLCHQASTGSVILSGNVPGTVYSWVNSTTSIGLAAGGSGDISSFMATNTTTAPVTATISVTPSFTNSGTTCTGISSPFTITVNPVPTVNTLTNQVLCNQAFTTSVTFSGNVPGTIYNWTNTNASIGIATNGTGDILSFQATNATTAPITATITVTPSYTNSGATCTGTSTLFTLTVNPIPMVNPVTNQVLCHQASTVSVILSGNVPGTVYSWVNSTTSIGLAASGSGDISSFIATNSTTAPVTATISVTPSFTNSGTTCTGISSPFTITVNPVPTVNTLTNQVLCNQAFTTSVTFSGNVPGTIYNWTNTNASIGLATNGTGDILSFQATNATTAPITATITVTPEFTNSGITCTGISTFFTITVNPIPMVNPVTNQVLCHLASTASVILSGNVPGTVYSWVNSTTSIGLAASGSGNISSFMTTNTTTAPVTATISVTPSFTNSGTTCTGISSPFTITVNPVPTVNTLTNQILCNQAFTTSVTFSGNVPGTIYNWTNTNTSIGLAANGTGDILSFKATNATTAPITATITVTPEFTNSGITCTGISTFFTITVNPIPMVNPVTNQVLCHQASTGSVILSGTILGTVYSWVNSTTSIGLAASGTGNIVSFQVSNTTNAPVVATIVVTPTYTNAGGTCSGTPISFTITVNPLPIPTISGPGANCLNLSSTYTTEDFQFNYLWNVVSGGIITSGQFTKQIDILWNTLGTHTITVNYIDQHGCTSVLPTSKQVVINSIPVPTLTGVAIVCAGETKTYQTQTGAQSYSWGLPSSGITIVSGGSLHDDQVTIKWDVANVYNISVNYIISTGCTAQNPTNLSVTVNAQPTPQITGPTPVCGLTMQSYSLSPIVSGHLYNWSVTGGTIQSGQNASGVQIFWGNSTSGSLDLNETINYPGISCSASAVPYPIVLNPWPDGAGSIIGQNSVCKTSTITYTIPSILNAISYQWLYTGTGVTIVNNGNSTISITFTSTATNGTLSVRGVNNCGDGPVSPPLNIAVHNLPEVSFIPCFDLITTTGAKKIILRGGTPYLSGQGVYSGNRVSLNASSGMYEFDPFGATPGNYSITYTFTNTFGCLAAVATVSISVQNNLFSCGGDMTDVRDGKKYKTAPLAGHCWMTQNLNYGTALVSAPVPPQSDNCVAEKYCTPTDGNCSAYGGLYQWDELMDYAIVPGAKGLCPPEWHLPTEIEWQSLIDNLVAGITAPDANATVAPDLTDPFIFNGFHALLGGLNYLDNSWAFYTGANTATMYWTSTIDGGDHAVARGLNVFTPSISKYISSRANAFSVRCVKD